MTHRSGPQGTNTGKGMSLGSWLAGPFPAPLPHQGLSPHDIQKEGERGADVLRQGRIAKAILLQG